MNCSTKADVPGSLWIVSDSLVSVRIRGEIMEIQQSSRWRAATLGLRIGLTSMPIMLVLMLLGRFANAKEIVVPIILTILPVAIVSILVGWVGAVLLIRDTSRYTGAASGYVNPSRAWELMQAAISDVCNFRKW
ncbi:hypothetical protein AB0883_12610 [Micromonospora sp. NPDC047812]|uniref:hypothetical protein n=1 Tax=Micromonospora sp. NPDC047812 TaxID=3155742 RepID=UPI003453E9D9